MVQRIALAQPCRGRLRPPQPSQRWWRRPHRGAGAAWAQAGSGVVDAGSPPERGGGAYQPADRPQCLDGQYRETLPPASADISALSSDYSPDAWHAYVRASARYPLG